jgi:putative membrane-bound dehydrogenase-like protein
VNRAIRYAAVLALLTAARFPGAGPLAPEGADAKPAAANVAAAQPAADRVAADLLATGKPARFVRIELPGDRRILTLAEVEVISGGKNVAREGRAAQSSTDHGGDGARAIDGNKDPEFAKGGQTHTQDGGTTAPWWEVDLGREVDVERVAVWNRSGYEKRLDGFTLTLLDADRKPVFRAANYAAPESMVIDVKQQGKATYLAFDGKSGKPGMAAQGGGAAQAKGDGKPETGLADVPADYRDPAPFAFMKGDVVAVLGNGLPDRMQHDGWMETLLQTQLPDLQVRFRNMSASGDRPGSYPRSSGHMSMTEYLRLVKADVVFGFFGYNESYDGVAKADDHRKRLVEFVRTTRATKANGTSFPRIVLFSPIAYENTRNPNLPDGKEQNAALEAYAKATEQAAKEAGVAFVDLFHPSLELYKSADKPLTINGVHLTQEGNRQLAEVIAGALFAKPVKASAALEPLRQAVVDKDVYWNNRYRARDGNDVWGGRSTLAFVNGQTNATVLQHELTMLDVLTANRDERIWARATGKDKAVDDSNVPEPIPVISNVGGGSKMSDAAKEGILRYQDGAEAINSMAYPKGFKVTLFADEKRFPELIKPVQLQVDTRGRLWAACWPTYPTWEPGKPMNDGLFVVHDDNNDGTADRITKFAAVQNPLGFEFWNGGVIVNAAPEILFLKDTDGDDVADVRQVVLQGLDSSDTHHGANNFIYGPDGGIYWQSGVFMVHNHEQPWGPSLQTAAAGEFRFDPRRFTIAFHAANSPNSHGIAFDYWGNHYATDGTTGNAFQVRPDGKGFKMFPLLNKEVRPVPACEVVSSANFPEAMQQDFLILNTIGFLGIKQYKLTQDPETGAVRGEPSGAELTVTTVLADGSKRQEKSRGLLMSGDKNFRPADAIFGADGALYVADWQNVIIGHMQHNIRDPNRDHVHGRIYRMACADRPLQKPVAIDGQPIPALLENLKHPIDGVRHRTRVELSERDSKEVLAAAEAWLKQFDPKKPGDAHHLLEGLWLYQQHNAKNPELLASLLESPEPRARFAARTAEQLWKTSAASERGGVIGDTMTDVVQKSGILSDTPELTTVRIGTIPERMMYDVKDFTVDFMPHNLVVVKPGKIDDVANKSLELGAGGFEVGFVPKSDDVLWATRLVDYEKEQVLEFAAPAQPGAYPYVCTFPGHAGTMNGLMLVANSKSEADQLAAAARKPVQLTDWKLADLAADADKVSADLKSRNPAKGMGAFMKAQCAACHQVAGHGIAVGPDLSKIAERFKGQKLLTQILEPSAEVNEAYKLWNFKLKKGDVIAGTIVKQDAEGIDVMQNPLQPKVITHVAAKDVARQVPSKMSAMPQGLLSPLTKDEILDLLAFLETGGTAIGQAHGGHH